MKSRLTSFVVCALLVMSAVSRADLTSTQCAPFGVANKFNLFVLGDLDHRNTDTQGAVAVGGNAYLSHYSVAQKTLPSDLEGYALVVDGQLRFDEGSVWSGAVAYGGFSQVSTSVFAPHGKFAHRPIDFHAAVAHLRNLSERLAKVKSTGEPVLETGAITLVGKGNQFNSFTVRGEDLAQVTFLRLDVPQTTTVVVNVVGRSSAFRHFGFELKGVTNQKVLFNFPDATELELLHVGIQGSLLAPKAAVRFNDGVIHGQLIASSLRGNGQVNWVKFKGCVCLE